MPRPIIAAIHVDALTHNLSVARQHSRGAKVWAVVKANAYGHGLDNALCAFSQADGLALVEVDGAVTLRESGWRKPILLLEGFFRAEDLVQVKQHHIDVVVHNSHQIDLLARSGFPAGANENSGKNVVESINKIRVHLKINGGMNRLGFKPAQAAVAFQRLQAIDDVEIVDMVMHFANADDAFNTNLPLAEQLRRFVQAQSAIKAVSETSDVARHSSLCNSASILLQDGLNTEWVRAGIMLYGGTPTLATAISFDLKPAMTLSSEVIAIQDLEVGDAVGYGSRFIAPTAMRIGVVACGYADGYPRHAPNGTPVLVDGVRTMLVGRVSMDMLTVDLSAIPEARVGSAVTLWGQGLPIDDVAHSAGTIGYELMCAVAQRVPLVVDSN